MILHAVDAIKQSLRPHLPYLAVLGLVTLLAGLPLFQFKIMAGHDALAYLPRSIELYQGLSSGHVFPRWSADFAYGYGEPTINFNPPVMYYLTAFFHVVGFSFIGSQNLALFAILALAGLGMYLLSGHVFGPRGGLVSAVAYLFAPYLLVNLYVRYALAAFSAFAFIPFAFWGLYLYATDGGYWRLFIGALSTALLILASSSVSLITFPPLLLLIAIVLFFESWNRKSDVLSKLARGLWLLVLGLGLSVFAWLPSLTEKEFVHLDRRMQGYADFHNHFLYIQQLFLPHWGYGFSFPGPEDGMNFAVGPIHLLLVAASLYVIWRMGSKLRQDGVLLLLFASLILLAGYFTISASGFIWDRLSVLHLLQFPWRFLSLMAVSTAFVSGSLFSLPWITGKRLADGLMWGLIIALIVVGFPHAKPQGYVPVTDASFNPSMIALNGTQTTARQLEPIWVKRLPSAPAAERLSFTEGSGQIFTSKLTPTYYEFGTNSPEPARMRVNTFYFPGWKVFVDDTERPVEIDSVIGVMEFSLEPGIHQIQVRFTDTPVRRWSERLSLLSLLLLFLTPWIVRRFRSPSLAIFRDSKNA